MRIGVYGLTGDPLHNLHLAGPEQARVQLRLDFVLYVTSGQPVDKPHVTDKNIRHAIVTAGTADNKDFIPTRVEVDREGPSFMADTLRAIRKEHGEQHEYFLIIGEDRVPTIASWHEPEAIAQLAQFAVLPRTSESLDKAALEAVLPKGSIAHPIELSWSSTFIRKQVKAGLSVRYLVPDTVLPEISQHALYGYTKPVQPSKSAVTKGTNMSKRRRITRKPRRSGIRCILDNDLYKFSMCNGVLRKHPNVRVSYKFNDRKAKEHTAWTPSALEKLQQKIADMSGLRLSPQKRAWCEAKMPWINRSFWDFLANYRFDPSEVRCWLDENNVLQIEITGLWCRTILWEVPLLALVSEVYYEEIDTNWSEDGQEEKMEDKARRLAEAGVAWGDFGTRRRRHFDAQERVVRIGKKYANFTGTSNVFLAMKYDVKPLGTMAHEWIMAHSALFSLRHANKFALEAWNDVYQGNLGTALPDTFGTDAFLRDFDGVLARLFDSVRHDSGDPFEWAEKMIAHYKSLGIDPKSKPLGFTDGNTVESAIEIHNWMKAKGLRCWFGIGTSLTNDYGPDSPAVSIVIKLAWVEDADGSIIHVVKLSDTPGKATGNADAVRVVRWTHYGTPLDA